MKIINGKLIIERKSYKENVSQSAKQKDVVLMRAKDVEMHSTLSMNKTDSESTTSSEREGTEHR